MKILRFQTTLVALIAALFTTGAQAQTVKIPAPIMAAMATSTKQGTCETRWPEMAISAGVISVSAGEGMTLWMIPCAQWAHNLGWAAFVTINEPSHVDGFLTKALRFVNYTPYEGIVAQDLIYNIEFDGEKLSVTSQYFLNGVDFCGARSKYLWSPEQQNLVLQQLQKQDVCKAPGGPWQTLFKK
jgi:hypothetical protein